MGRDNCGVICIPMAGALAGLKDAQDCQVCIPQPHATVWCSLKAARGDAKQIPQGRVPSLVNANSSTYKCFLVNHEEHEHAQAHGYSWLSAYPCLFAASVVSISPFLLLLLGSSISPERASVSLAGEPWVQPAVSRALQPITKSPVNPGTASRQTG